MAAWSSFLSASAAASISPGVRVVSARSPENGAEDVVFAAPTTVAAAELEAFVASISE